MTFHYLYKITHVPSGRYYHGRHSYKSLDNNYFGSGRWVKSIIDKTTLQKEILQIFESQEELIEAETSIIRENWEDPLQMNWNDSGVGWSSATNPSKINHPWKGRKHTEETKMKVSEAKKRQYASGEVIHPCLGRVRSEEAKDKQRQKMKGRKLTPEHANKLKQSRLGKGQTANQKEKAREANQKDWLVTFPDGHQEIVTNLRQFALVNALDQGNLMHVVSGRQKQHKGFRVCRL
jgi:hypothetical protein